MNSNVFLIISTFIFVVCLRNISTLDIGVGDGCNEVLNSYAENTANFTKCVVQYARPIQICQQCVQPYLDVIESHRLILELHDESGVACQLELLNVDKLQIVESSFLYVTSQWNRASCQKCFENSESNVTRFNTNKIILLSDQFAACANNNKNDTNQSLICEKCRNDYLTLNNFYDMQKSEEGFCMDIVDLMNVTRNKWSTVYKCSLDLKGPEWIFLASSAFVASLPVIFYSVLRIFSAKTVREITMQKRWIRRLSTASSGNVE